jgi:hypothetical protein
MQASSQQAAASSALSSTASTQAPADPRREADGSFDAVLEQEKARASSELKDNIEGMKDVVARADTPLATLPQSKVPLCATPAQLIMSLTGRAPASGNAAANANANAEPTLSGSSTAPRPVFFAPNPSSWQAMSAARRAPEEMALPNVQRFDQFKAQMGRQTDPGNMLDIQLTDNNACEVRLAPRKVLKERLRGSLLHEKAVAARSGLIGWKQLEEFTNLANSKLDRVTARLQARQQLAPTEARAGRLDALSVMRASLGVLKEAATKRDVNQLDAAQQLAAQADTALSQWRGRA